MKMPLNTIAFWRSMMLPLAMVAFEAGPSSDLQPQLRAHLSREFQFSSADLADLERGKIVKHGLDATAPGEIAAVGAVRVRARKEVFVAQYRNIAQLKRGPDVLQIGCFSDPPTIS